MTEFEDFLEYCDDNNHGLKEDIKTWLADHFDLPHRDIPLLASEIFWIRENLSPESQEEILGISLMDYKNRFIEPDGQVRVWGYPTDHGGVDYLLCWRDDGDAWIESVGFADGGSPVNDFIPVGEFLNMVLPQNDFAQIRECILERKEARL